MDHEEIIGMQAEAEGAAAQGTEQPATGEQTADAALKHLMEDMKIPREKAEIYLKAKSRQGKAAQTNTQTTTQTDTAQQTRTETQPTEAPAEPEAKESEPSPAADTAASPRPSFDELIRDGEYKQAFQQKTENIVKERVARLSGYKDAMETVKPMLLDIAALVGVDTTDPDKLDYSALVQAFRNDPENYRRAAAARGIDNESARTSVQTRTETDQLRRRIAELESEKKQSAQQEIQNRIIDQHMSTLRQQEAELKKSVPDFNLDRELNDPETGKKFRDLTIPGSGWSVTDAYRLIHWREIEAQTRKAAAEQSIAAVAASVAAGQQRPRENNPSAGSGSSQHTLFSQKSKAERDEIIRRAKRGEKISF